MDSGLDIVSVQDNMVFSAQGEIADRTQERLGESDRGIIMYRQLLREQTAIVEDGGEPMNVFRDPETNQSLPLPTVLGYYARGRTSGGSYRKGAITAPFAMAYSPFRDHIEDLYEAEALAKGMSVE